ncbi:MAG TPA: RNB domain-containing ribonuclease [Thermoanaerobaculaceae bacterium]|nr:RNB domain-containing ribonuclease [Thermoanaerobaculaceae bacterium]
MDGTDGRHRATLERIAHRVMLDRGLEPDFSPQVIAQVERLTAAPVEPGLPDLRELPWCSIDNDDSMDLDQLSVAREQPDGSAQVLVAIADVDALAGKGSPADGHARVNTTSVYTAAEIFPMLPEKLSTDLTSLADRQDRQAVVVEIGVGPDGSVARSDVYRAVVRNRAKLAYGSVAAWLEGRGPAPPALAAVPGLEANLRKQDEIAQRFRELRHEQGALELHTIETRAVFDADEIRDLRPEERNRAKELIEDLMVAANGVTARFLEAKGVPSLRRVVRTPKRWDRIVEVAAQLGESLPAQPDASALAGFLARRRAADPLRFPDLSLTVVKLLGAGEYVVERPGQGAPGHFGLAVRDYTHATAPNRRFPDLVTQRLLKGVLAGAPPAYGDDELAELATHCTQQEDAANKVERQVAKSAAALLLADKIGQGFDGIVTGASDKGTWVRVFHPPVEGRLVHGFEGADVGHRVRVRLVHTDVERGFIDFAMLGGASR